MNYAQLQALVPARGQRADFQQCLAAFPALEHAKTTPQDPRHHGEGDVWTHTQKVVDALLALDAYQRADRASQEIVFFAALLHDVAKHSTTRIDSLTGATGHPGHARKGAIDARIALWDLGAPFAVREAICRLIAVHQAPFFAMSGARRGPPEFVVRELSWQVNIGLLAMLARADMTGRICADAARTLDDIALFEELAKEEGCHDQPRAFASAHTAVSYFRGADVHPDYPLFQPPGARVIVMSGLPASGKNTWVAQHHPDLPVVSFDDAREALGLRYGKNEGLVAHSAIDRAKALLRQHTPFVWNATNITTTLRKKTLDLLLAYHADITLVYLEKPRAELLRRNSQRNGTLPNRALENMLLKWDVPLPTEAHAVVYDAG